MDLRNDILPHRDRLYRLALGITMHTAEAEDIVQDTMLRAWERRDEWPNIKNIASWLTEICKNLSLDRKKRLERLSQLPTETKGEASPADTPTSNTPNAEMNEQIQLLQQLMSQLPPPQDDIIRLRDIEGLSYRDIANQLGISEDQVRVYLHRARTSIRSKYTAIQNFGLNVR